MLIIKYSGKPFLKSPLTLIEENPTFKYAGKRSIFKQKFQIYKRIGGKNLT